jgi:rubredoxin
MKFVDRRLDRVQCPNCGGYKSYVVSDSSFNFLLDVLDSITIGLFNFEQNARNNKVEQAKRDFWQGSNLAHCQICGYEFSKQDLRPVEPNIQLIQKAEEQERRRRMMD